MAEDKRLARYDMTKRARLYTDPSKLHGLGFMLLQEEDSGLLKIVECGSRSLTDTKGMYATVEL